jgi:hypothetical protein
MFRCLNPEMLGDGSLQVRLPSNLILVRVRDELPGISRKELTDRCLEAWSLWEAKIGITVALWNESLHGGQGTPPTQIVTAHNFGDGASGVLADQQLPYGNGNNLLMRIDAPSVKLSRADFVTMVCHENGHCLGLSHNSPNDGIKDLMDPMLQSGIVGPQPGDVTVARKMGYGMPGQDKPVPSKGRYIEVTETDEAGQKWVCAGYFKKAS